MPFFHTIPILNMHRYITFLLFYRSSGAYETPCESGCLKLASQRTLKDYTHYVKASPGFSREVDIMLHVYQADKVKTCPDYENAASFYLMKFTSKRISFSKKHTRDMIGFANLGDINEHLQEKQYVPSLVKTMMVFYGSQTVQ